MEPPGSTSRAAVLGPRASFSSYLNPFPVDLLQQCVEVAKNPILRNQLILEYKQSCRFIPEFPTARNPTHEFTLVCPYENDSRKGLITLNDQFLDVILQIGENRLCHVHVVNQSLVTLFLDAE